MWYYTNIFQEKTENIDLYYNISLEVIWKVDRGLLNIGRGIRGQRVGSERF